jgi:hypothetical protein
MSPPQPWFNDQWSGPIFCVNLRYLRANARLSNSEFDDHEGGAAVDHFGLIVHPAILVVDGAVVGRCGVALRLADVILG